MFQLRQIIDNSIVVYKVSWEGTVFFESRGKDANGQYHIEDDKGWRDGGCLFRGGDGLLWERGCQVTYLASEQSF